MPREWRPHHAPQVNANRAVKHSERAGLAAAASIEDLRHDWADEEGDREGGRGDPTRGYEGDDAENKQ